MGHNVAKQQNRLEVIDKWLKKMKPISIKELHDKCNDELNISTTERQYRCDIDTLKKDYGAPIGEEKKGGCTCFYYKDPSFSIKGPGVLNSTDYNNLNKIMEYLRDFVGLDADAQLSDIRFQIGSFLGYDENDIPVISVEKTNLICRGEERLERKIRDIFDAIVKQQTLNVVYFNNRGQQKEWTIFPQLLKQYNQRWYLIATKHRDEKGEIQNLALDQLESYEANGNIVYERSKIDFAEYFENVVGVTVPQNSEPQKIILQVIKGQYHYIQSKPIHYSQKEEPTNCEDYVRISLKVYINRELINQILSFGSKVTVIEPQTLKDKITDELKKSLENYK